MSSVTLAVPTTGYMHHQFVESLIGALSTGLIGAVNIVPRLPIHQARQRIAETTDTEFVLFVDDDMVFTPEDVEAIIKTPGDIVSGLAVTRSKKPQPVVFTNNDGAFTFRTDYTPDAMQQVDATTLAFTKVAMRVFDKIGTEFAFRDGLGEDLDFCKRASEAGFLVVLNSSVKVGHITQDVLYAEDTA